jgi:hypothetical protein
VKVVATAQRGEFLGSQARLACFSTAGGVKMPVKPGLVGSALVALLVVPAAVSLQGCFGTRRPATQVAAPLPPIHTPARVITVDESQQYLGSQACVGCHPKQAVQLKSRHARTVARVRVAEHRKQFERRQRVVDPATGITYTVAVKGDRCVMIADDGKQKLEGRAYYAFGSGRRAITYLGPSPEGAMQLRLSWFPEHGWSWTPGLKPGSPGTQKTGEVLGESGLTECFTCHTTTLVKRDTGLAPELSTFNVGCEGCHGPGKGHVEAIRTGNAEIQMVRLKGESETATLRICDRCHTGPGQADLNDPVKVRNLPRFPGAALAFSRCATKGGANCMSCHDPHRDADQTTRAEYNRACRNCHLATAAQPLMRKECPVQPDGDCVPCHMPQQSTGLPSPRLFHNHWIKAWSASKSGTPALNGSK